MKKPLRYLLPLGVFAALLGFLFIGLSKDPHDVPSPLVGKPAPAFELTTLDGNATFSPASMQGKVWLLNVWASWCGACREEMPYLQEVAHHIPIVGLDYKDTHRDARQWLEQTGNPFQLTAFDGDGRVGIDYGVYGVPETYVIDSHGVVRYKLTGPMTPDIWQHTIQPLLQELRS